MPAERTLPQEGARHTHFFQPARHSFEIKRNQPSFFEEADSAITTVQILRQSPIAWRGCVGDPCLVVDWRANSVQNSLAYLPEKDKPGSDPFDRQFNLDGEHNLSAVIYLVDRLQDPEWANLIHSIDTHLARLNKLAGIYIFERRNGQPLTETEINQRKITMRGFNLEEETISVIDAPDHWIIKGRVGEKWEREPWQKKKIQATYQPPLFREDGKEGVYVYFAGNKPIDISPPKAVVSERAQTLSTVLTNMRNGKAWEIDFKAGQGRNGCPGCGQPLHVKFEPQRGTLDVYCSDHHWKSFPAIQSVEAKIRQHWANQEYEKLLELIAL